MSLAALRQQLTALIAPPRAGVGAVPTGVAALDRALSDGGLPHGRLTEIFGLRGSGKTTLVRQIVAAAIVAGRGVAYVDGTRTLAPRDWALAGGTRRLWIVRPPNAERSAWCADVLLRSGAFGLVVLDGGPPLSRPVAIRLTRLARERDVALVVVGDERTGPVVGGAVRLHVRRRPTADSRRQQVRGPRSEVRGPHRSGLWPAACGLSVALQIVVEKGGSHQSVEVRCAIDVARRLCAHPEVPDRRGVAPRNRRGERAAPGTLGARRPAEPGEGRRETGDGRPERPIVPTLRPPPSAPPSSTLQRKRRCAEPIVRRDDFLLAGGCRR